ncbi:MAG: protein translocase subunit SecF [Gammaproteobacteria bacterium]
MEFFKIKLDFDFMSQRRVAYVFSSILMVVAVLSLILRGLNFGIDFTGGTLIEIEYPRAVEVAEVRATLAETGFDDALVQQFGTAHDILIRVAPREGVGPEEVSDRIFRSLQQASGSALDLRRVEFVGPQVGEELREDGGLALLIALGAILVYIAFRFEYRLALGAVAALVHDVIVTVGFFSVLGLEFSLVVLAALLAVIGYSLNDTIVVFDRIRENFRKIRKGDAVTVVNAAINQTLSRTVMTGVTTLLVLVALYFLGGEVLQGFSLALIIGIVIGTYSSIYIASALALALGISRTDLMLEKKEETHVNRRL